MAFTSRIALPEPSSEDAFVTVSPFDTAVMKCPQNLIIKDAPGDYTCGSWRFFISHAPSKTKLWFDLGVSHDLSVYTQPLHDLQIKLFNTIAAPNSISEDMRKLQEDPDDVKYIILSHAHWDHVFPVKDQLPNATVLCGPGTLNIMKDHGYWPHNKKSEYDEKIWDPEHSELPIKEFPRADKWEKLGTFDNALDFFGDGSLYLIDTPGHLAGNISALCRTRTKNGETRWILLAGDCFHSHHFVSLPETPFGAISFIPSGCIHVDPAVARDTIRRISALRESDPRVRVWAAHAGSLEGHWEFN